MIKMTFISIISLLLVLIPRKVLCNSGVYCVGLGVNSNKTLIDFNWIENDHHKQFYSIGAELYKNTYQKALGAFYTESKSRKPDQNQTCPVKGLYYSHKRMYKGKEQTTLNICPKPSVIETRVSLVKQNGTVLKGWLHVEIELVDKTDAIELVYVQMRDENFNAIGEFVTDPKEQCKSTANLATPSTYQYLPCTATGLREPKNSQGLYVVQKDNLLDPDTIANSNKYLHQTGNLSRGVHFTWRYGENWCSRHLKIRPDAFILTKNHIKKFLQDPTNPDPDRVILRKAGDHWLKPAWFGAWDISVESRGPLQCDTLVMNNTQIKLQDWISGSESYVLGTDYYSIDNQYLYNNGSSAVLRFLRSCQVDSNSNNPAYSDATMVPKFSGRCESVNDKFPAPNKEQFQSCNRDRNAPEFKDMLKIEKLKNYTEYLTERLHNRTKHCNSPCKAPKDQNDRKAILSFQRGEVKANKTLNVAQKSGNISSTQLTKFWRGRKYHAILCIVAGMVVTPISIFTSRYYKETFMDSQGGGCHTWYWTHIVCTIISFTFYMTSETAILPSVVAFGSSDDQMGKFHRRCGWVSHGLFTFLTIFGGVRFGIRRKQRVLRLFSMLLHGLLGFGQYILTITLVVTSSAIPGSPTLDKCGELGFPVGISEDLSEIARISIGWLVVDVVFHLILTGLQFTTDKTMQLKRGCYCPIMPVLRHTSYNDLRPSKARKLLYYLYIVTCVGFALWNLVILVSKDLPSNCELGRMDCERAISSQCKLYQDAFYKTIT